MQQFTWQHNGVRCGFAQFAEYQCHSQWVFCAIRFSHWQPKETTMQVQSFIVLETAYIEEKQEQISTMARGLLCGKPIIQHWTRWQSLAGFSWTKWEVSRGRRKFSFTRFWRCLALKIYILVFQLVTLFNILGGYKISDIHSTSIFGVQVCRCIFYIDLVLGSHTDKIS